MATGIEIAGLALAVFPIAIDCLKRFSKGVNKMRNMKNYQCELRKFVRELDTERVLYINTCEEVLNGIVTENEADQMIQHPHSAAWKEPQLREKLRLRLRQAKDTLKIWLRTVKNLQQTLAEVADHFKQSEKDKKTFKAFLAWMNDSLKSYREEKMGDIRTWNRSLHELANGNQAVMTTRYDGKQDPSRLLEYHRRVQKHAAAIDNVFQEKLQHPICQCLRQHVVNLHLELRTFGVSNDQKRHRSSKQISSLMFEFLIATAGQDPAPEIAWTVLRLEYIDDELDEDVAARQTSDLLTTSSASSSQSSIHSIEPITIGNSSQIRKFALGKGIAQSINNRIGKPLGNRKKASVAPPSSSRPYESIKNINKCKDLANEDSRETSSSMRGLASNLLSKFTRPAQPPAVASLISMVCEPIHPKIALNPPETAIPTVSTNNEGSSAAKKPDRRITFQTPSLNSLTNNSRTTIDKPEETLTTIKTFCVVLASYTSLNEPPNLPLPRTSNITCLGLLVGQNNKKHRVWYDINTHQYTPVAASAMISLSDLIAHFTEDNAPSRMDRCVLGFKLVSSVMQLGTTRWLGETWGTKDILFAVNTNEFGAVDKHKHSILSRPFVRQKLPSNHNEKVQNTADASMIIPTGGYNNTLYSLGIVLMELWHWQTFESLCAKHWKRRSPGVQNATTGQVLSVAEHYILAHNLANQFHEEAGIEYGDAVRRCICGLDLRATSLGDAEFFKAVCLKVVYPLEENVHRFCEGERLEELLRGKGKEGSI